MEPDLYQLERFVQAQARVWEDVQEELRTGRKTSHWMWFVFPQLARLGRSSTAKYYGIAGRDEAEAYLSHPVLGPRLVACCEVLVAHSGPSVIDIFGTIDATKLRSCLTLFAAIASEEDVFERCLEQFFSGEGDSVTLQALAS